MRRKGPWSSDRIERFLEEAQAELDTAIRLRDEPQGPKPYRLKKGKKFTMRGTDGLIVHHRGGDIVELTPHQARMFASHFEPADKPTRKEPITVEDDEPEVVEHTTEKQLKKRASVSK